MGLRTALVGLACAGCRLGFEDLELTASHVPGKVVVAGEGRRRCSRIVLCGSVSVMGIVSPS